MNKYTTERIAREIIESGDALPPLPAVSQRLLVISRQPIDQIDVASFSKLIEGDPALTAKILQLANSSFFGTLKKIVNIRQAIMHIGLEETITSVYNFFFKDSLPKFPQIDGFSGKDYWDHSWAVATANRMLGHPVHHQMNQTLPGELYIAGLLHGIGKIILATNRTEDFQRCLEYSKETGEPLEQAEIKIFGIPDTEIAFHVLTNWNFPEHICLAIRHLHTPFNATKEIRGLAALTQLAYYIANTSGIGSNGDNFEYDLAESYVLQNWLLPRTEKQQQEIVIENIYTTMEKKSAILSEESGEQQKDKPSTTTSIKQGNNQTEHPKKKKGFLGKLLSFVK